MTLEELYLFHTLVISHLQPKDNKTYIGKKGRLLRTSRNEHRNNINLSEKYHSVVSKHILEFDHDFNWDNLLILHKEKN